MEGENSLDARSCVDVKIAKSNREHHLQTAETIVQKDACKYTYDVIRTLNRDPYPGLGVFHLPRFW